MVVTDKTSQSDQGFSPFQCIQNDLEQYRSLLLRRLDSQVELVNQVAQYIFSGGKGYRPALLLLMYRCFNQRQESQTGFDQALLLAVATEYIHVATLLHDDVVDNSNFRRGKKTAKVMFGNASSVLVGDFVYSRAFQLLVEANCFEAIKIFAETTNTIAEGEVMQLMNIGKIPDSVEHYFQIIYGKTASLFEAAARIGAVIAKASFAQQQVAAEYGRLLGIIFQIVDDVLDYRGSYEMMGKSLGNDLLEGKMTLPAILAFNQASFEDRQRITNFTINPKPNQVAEIRRLVVANKGIDGAMQYALDRQKKALEVCQQLPPNEFSKALKKLVRFSVKRDY